MLAKLRKIVSAPNLPAAAVVQPESLPDIPLDPAPVVQPLSGFQTDSGDYRLCHLPSSIQTFRDVQVAELSRDSTQSVAKSFPFYILTWNIDFMSPHPEQRLIHLLNYLSTLLHFNTNADLEHNLDQNKEPNGTSTVDTDGSRPTYKNTILLLQELHSKCFPTLLSHPLVRQCYAVTDASTEYWRFGTHYGLVTLVPVDWSWRVSPIGVFRIKFKKSVMARDVVFVDLDWVVNDAQVGTEGQNQKPTKQSRTLGQLSLLRARKRNSSGDKPKPIIRKIRIANSHLESLASGAEERTTQLTVISKFLQAPGVYAGIYGGDTNCDRPEDENLPSQLGLVDAWVHRTNRMDADQRPGEEVDREETGSSVRQGDMSMNPTEIPHNSPEGCTFGYQSPDKEYVHRRLDKLLLAGRIEVGEMTRIGVDIKGETNGKRSVWVSDHYGLLAKVVVQ